MGVWQYAMFTFYINYKTLSVECHQAVLGFKIKVPINNGIEMMEGIYLASFHYAGSENITPDIDDASQKRII